MRSLLTVVRRGHRLALAAAVAAGWGCQGEPPPAVTSPAPVITIIGSVESPERLEVPPGATVVVENFDPIAHTVTSASAPGTYTSGGVNGVSFDTGPITSTGAFTIPANAPVGTVVPYFCSLHGELMQEHGEIAIVAPGGASSQ